MRTGDRTRAALLAALLVLPLAACSALPRPSASAGSGVGAAGAHSDSSGDAAVAPAPAVRSIRTAIVGDSLSAGASGYLGDGLDADSWMTWADAAPIAFVGGWAKAGTDPREMAAAVRPIENVDVLVILAGTNAVIRGQSFSSDASSYRSIVRVIAPAHVLVVAIPPSNPLPAAAASWNESLMALAAHEGWAHVDPWGAFRAADNSYVPGSSVDGVHPYPSGYRTLGAALRPAIIAAASD